MLPENLRKYVERYPTLGLIGGTRLLSVEGLDAWPDNGATLHAKCEWTNPGGSLKDRPVRRMLLEEIERGRLTRERSIIDSSSGNAGIAYAMIGAMMGYDVTLVLPGNASAERKKRILAHGAKLIQTDPLEGYDAALREAHRLAEEHADKYFMPDQYANDGNWRAHYDETAVEILEQTGGELTHFISGIGTGGTITGVGRRLKEHDPSIKIVQVLPEVFPGIEGLKPLESPEDIVPKILDTRVVDEQVRVSIEDAFDYCNALARRGIFVGQSSGAYLKAAVETAKANPGARIVTLFCDIGERYFSTRLWD
ncbi:MAG: cysteine synthase family protein [Myxococcales bacterium]|nr:cysteine synthase family protein [Myxococcales bacterium]